MATGLHTTVEAATHPETPEKAQPLNRMMWIVVTAVVTFFTVKLSDHVTESVSGHAHFPPMLHGHVWRSDREVLTVSAHGEVMFASRQESWQVRSLHQDDRSQLEGELVCSSHGQRVGVLRISFLDNQQIRIEIRFIDGRSSAPVSADLTILP